MKSRRIGNKKIGHPNIGRTKIVKIIIRGHNGRLEN